MSSIRNAFDGYGDLNRPLFFASKYEVLCSKLELEVSMVVSKINMDKVLSLLNLEKNGFQLMLKNWHTDDASNAKMEKDFPDELLFTGIEVKGMIWITLYNKRLNVEFLYDGKDQALEPWVLKMNDLLRKSFGLTKKPTFSVLTKPNNCFSTEEVRTEKVVIDLDRHYNDDFRETFNRVERSIKAKESGLILLYGKPGTGKTTYIKSLISKHKKANFIFIQNEFVQSLLDPDFISFLLRQRNSVLVIEDAEKVITSRENANGRSVVSTILQLTDGLFSDYLNIKVICTFNTNLAKVDTALLRKGRMIAMYEFDKLRLDKTNRLLAAINAKESYESLSLADIFNVKERSYAETKTRPIGF